MTIIFTYLPKKKTQLAYFVLVAYFTAPSCHLLVMQPFVFGPRSLWRANWCNKVNFSVCLYYPWSHRKCITNCLKSQQDLFKNKQTWYIKSAIWQEHMVKPKDILRMCLVLLSNHEILVRNFKTQHMRITNPLTQGGVCVQIVNCLCFCSCQTMNYPFLSF